MSTALQAGFSAALLDAGRPVPDGLRAWNGSDPARRFAVYRNNVVVSLTQALADTFPVVQQLVGDEFFAALSRAYLREHPPNSPVLAHWGDGFADWLAAFASTRALPYLPDMARLERARVLAWHAPDATPLTPDELRARLAQTELLPGARLALHPACRVLRSPWDVQALWSAHQREDDWPALDIDRPSAMLVLRDPHDEVLVIGLDDAAADFIEALVAGARFGEALARASGVDLAATLALLLRHGAITGWAAPGDPS